MGSSGIEPSTCTTTSAGQCAAGYGGDAATGCTECTAASTYTAVPGNVACIACDSNAETGSCTTTSAGQCAAGYGGDAATGCTECTAASTYTAVPDNVACAACPSGAGIEPSTCTTTSAGQCAAGYGGDAATGCTECTVGTDYSTVA